MIFLFRICTSCDVSAVAMMYKLYHIVHYCTCTDFLYCHLNHSMFVNRSHCYCLSYRKKTQFTYKIPTKTKYANKLLITICVCSSRNRRSSSIFTWLRFIFSRFIFDSTIQASSLRRFFNR